MKKEDLEKFNPIMKQTLKSQAEILKLLLYISIVFIFQMYSLYQYLNGNHWVYIITATACVFLICYNAFRLLIEFSMLITLNMSNLSVNTISTLRAFLEKRDDLFEKDNLNT
ncbi:MAG: hypothetical protein MJZ34_06955 [Paludibacteraceae bacterium]|nr:hypothetical protein [Paludibacteraceae bacterium]